MESLQLQAASSMVNTDPPTEMTASRKAYYLNADKSDNSAP